MAWQTFGEGAVAAVATAWQAVGITPGTVGITAGESVFDCPDMPSVTAWISGVDPDPTPPPCVVTPMVVWTLRVGDCDPDGWHTLLQTAWCAVADYADLCCRPSDDLTVSINGLTVATPSGGIVYADLTMTVTESC